jgi:hypothetical protein
VKAADRGFELGPQRLPYCLPLGAGTRIDDLNWPFDSVPIHAACWTGFVNGLPPEPSPEVEAIEPCHAVQQEKPVVMRHPQQ